MSPDYTEVIVECAANITNNHPRIARNELLCFGRILGKYLQEIPCPSQGAWGLGCGYR